MIKHYYNTNKKHGNLCNTKTKSTPTKNKNETTCKKCKFILTSNELLSNYDEGNIIAQDIREAKRF